MSWSFTINGSVQTYEIDPALSEQFEAVNPDYPGDMILGLVLAKALDLKTATITGFRTPSPYGGPDTISVSAMGTVEATDWVAHVKAGLNAGPDE